MDKANLTGEHFLAGEESGIAPETDKKHLHDIHVAHKQRMIRVDRMLLDCVMHHIYLFIIFMQSYLFYMFEFYESNYSLLM